MSGIASLVIAFIAAYYELTDHGKPALWVAAASCLLIASFMVWYKNRPDLIIEVRDAVLDSNYGGMIFTNDTSPLPQFLTLTLYLVNTRQANNSIKSYELYVNVFGRKLLGQSFGTNGLIQVSKWMEYPNLNNSKLTVLAQGVPTEGWLRFGFEAEPSIKGHEFVLIITDAYNVTRRVKGRIPLDFSKGLIRRPPPNTLHF